MRASRYRTAATVAASTIFALLLAGSAFAVTITAVTPIIGTADAGNACAGAVVTITGTGFANDGPTSGVSVAFNGTKASYVEVGSNVVVYTRVPTGATDGPITVTTAAGAATSTTSFDVVPCQNSGGAFPAAASTSTALKASISSFKPAKAKAGAKLTVTGTGFTGASAVKIGGAQATFKVVSATKITATVPAKAKSGKISITTPAGTTTSSTLFVKA
jgi:hypothetical protein